MIKESLWDVVVIGGGPAGMLSAGRVGERNLRTLLLEKISSWERNFLL